VTTQPATWGAAIGSAVALFVVAVALVLFGPANAPTNATPTPPAVAHATPSASAGPGTPGPDSTPTAPSTAKVEAPRSVGPRQLTGYGWPLKRAWITSRFAHRSFGNFIIVDGVEYHDGLDLATHCGDTVYAAHGGTVLANDRTFDRYIGYKGHPEDIYNRTLRNGNPKALAIAVVVDDGNGYRSLYMHLKEALVVPGQVVRKGDPIGKEGATGAATGCHVHYGLIRMDGVWQQVLPRLNKYGYPLLIREHVDPTDVLPWGDEWAPLRLYNQIHPPSPTPLPTSTPSTATPSPAPSGSPATPSPTASAHP
jgi:murein DD-endopeptidase MepM/ murein hydrolase activator NlpD